MLVADFALEMLVEITALILSFFNLPGKSLNFFHQFIILRLQAGTFSAIENGVFGMILKQLFAAPLRIPEHPATHSDTMRPPVPIYSATYDALP